MDASSQSTPGAGESTSAGQALLAGTADRWIEDPLKGCGTSQEFPHLPKESPDSKDLGPRERLHRLRRLKRRFEYQTGRFSSVLQFGAVGLTGMVVDLLAFALAQNWLPLGFARAVSIWIAMTWNYFLNRHLTFSHARTTSVCRQYLLFCASCMAGALANWSTSMGLCSFSAFFAQAPLLAAVLGVLVGFAFNYCLSRNLVFRS